MTLDLAISIATEFAETEIKPHFEKISFRVRSKIFATMDESKMDVVLKFTEEQQTDFCDRSGAIQPVPGGWGRKGWTQILLEEVDEVLFREAVTTSYCNVAPKKLAALYQGQI